MKPLAAIGFHPAVKAIERGEDGGAFKVRFGRQWLHVQASFGMGWDHVSVSLNHRCPTWDELEHVKRIFFEDDETAMQLHVAPSAHVNLHPHCLHLWRPQTVPIPLPDKIMV